MCSLSLKLWFWLISCVFLFSIPGLAQNTSNRGKDFWVGYGNHVSDWPGNNQGGQSMSLYITSDVSTTGKVEIPGISYSQSFSVIANTITEVAIPPAARLNKEGLFDTGIHITSEKNIVVYAHIYASSVSGASIVLPTNSLGKSYISLNYTQESNSDYGYSYFFVIATEDDTEVSITPTQASIDGKVANTPFNVTLKKGQVYQYLSEKDLTGSLIQSIATSQSSCKRIAVFSGSGKIAIGCKLTNRYTSSDNLIQQVYPTNSWGKEYVSVPLKSRKYDYLRIVKATDNTQVSVNGTVIPNSQFVNKIYEFEASEVKYIKADNPIQVIQYAVTQGQGTNCTNFDGDVGDPEMIFLNALEQNLDHITMYSSPKFNIQSNLHFVNVVIPTSSVSSFTMDNNSKASLFTAVPGLPAYSYAQLNVSAGVHNLSASLGFNAIAYGFGDHESYGYAAGANVKNLGIEAIRKADGSVANSVCLGDPVYMKLYLPFEPYKIDWDFGNGNPIVTQNNPISVNTVIKDRITYYVYEYNIDNTVFSTPKDYNISVSAYNGSASGDPCGSVLVVDASFSVFAPPILSFTSANTCEGQVVQFTNKSDLFGADVKQWKWDFGDGTTSNLESPTHFYTAPGTYQVSLNLDSYSSCPSIVASPVAVKIFKKPIAVFSIAGNCAYKEIVFSDQSVSVDGAITKWNWDLGDGTQIEANTGDPIKHIYKKTGNYQVSLTVEADNGCTSLAKVVTLTIKPNAIVDFQLPGACVSDMVEFKNLSYTNDASSSPLTYFWNFGDPASGTSNNSNAINGKHYFSQAGVYTISLTAKTNNACDTTVTKVFSVNGADPKAKYELPNGNLVCSNDVLVLKNTSSVSFGSITRLEWYMDAENSSRPQIIDNEPSIGKVYTYQYPVHHLQQNKAYKVKLVAYSGTSCVSIPFESTIYVKGVPSLDTIADIEVCLENGRFTINEPGERAGFVSVQRYFSGIGVDKMGVFDPYKAGVGIHELIYTFIEENGCTVKDTFMVKVNATPILEMADEFFIDDGQKITLTGKVDGNISHVSWSPSNGLSATDILSPVASPKFTTTYTVNVYSNKGCVINKNIKVRVLKDLDIKNTFSPNGDGVNDTWEIPYINDYTGLQLDIYNRLGMKVYTIAGAYLAWDGKVNGTDLPAGVYFYVLDLKHGRKVKTGYLTIIR